MFFILSGFVLTLSLSKHQIPLLDFAYRRFLRLWPLHVIVLLFAVVVYELNRYQGRYAPEGSFSDIKLFLENAFFLMKMGIWEFPVINPPSYSIGIEFWVSALVVPLIARLRPFAALSVAGAGYLAVAVLWGGVSGADTVAPYLSLGVLRGVARMALGSAVFKLNEVYASRLSKIGPEWACAAVCISAVIVAVAVFGQTNSLLNFAVLFVFSGLLFSHTVSNAGFAYRFLSTKPLVWLGQMSFSLYLIHMPLLVLIGVPQLAQTTGRFNAAFVSLAVCMSAAATLYHFVDAPIDRFVKKNLRAKNPRRDGRASFGAQEVLEA